MTEFEPEGGDLDDVLRRVDPDRWLSSRFIADAQARACVTALYAFDHELARAREVVSQPPMALIRLEWWREVVEGARRQHEVAAPLLDPSPSI